MECPWSWPLGYNQTLSLLIQSALPFLSMDKTFQLQFYIEFYIKIFGTCGYCKIFNLLELHIGNNFSYVCGYGMFMCYKYMYSYAEYIHALSEKTHMRLHNRMPDNTCIITKWNLKSFLICYNYFNTKVNRSGILKIDKFMLYMYQMITLYL